MAQIKHLEKFKVPLSGQEIELQQVDYEGGGMSQLRIRIRERTRFTIVDVDPLTAEHWGVALREWARRQATAEAGRTTGQRSEGIACCAEAHRGRNDG